MKYAVALASTFAIASFTAPALADVTPPDVGACDHQVEGAACVDPSNHVSGKCVKSLCSHIAYYPDGGHGSEQSECLKCVAGGDTPGPIDASTSTSDSSAPVSPVGTATPIAADGGAAKATAPASSSSGGCSLGAAGAAAGPWLIAFVVPALLRRRRETSCRERS